MSEKNPEVPREVSLKVLVDDIPSVEGVVPAHGLSILVEASLDREKKRILFDTGPSKKILEYNVGVLGEHTRVDIIVGSIHLSHHIGCIDEYAERTIILRPPLPLSYKDRARLEEIRFLPDFYLVKTSSPWGEQGLLIPTEKGYILLAGCSVHGFKETFGWLFSSNLRIFGVVGGLGVSSRDMYNLGFLKRLSKKGVELIFPLHSVSLEARRKLMKLNRFPVDFEVPGGGSEISI
jgi:7,8-dihydropterin-6-yl-methyl-4-(beta-D-ribofuranosyl)aminobenzene 5'-phosphate synthase